MKEEDDMLELLEDDGTDMPAGEEQPAAEESGGREDLPVAEPSGREIEIDIRYVIIGIIALVGIIAVVGIFILMPMLAPPAPQAEFTSNQQGEDIIVVHNGGTPLAMENLRVSLDGSPVPAENLILLGGASSPWSPGSVLNINTRGYVKPATLTISYLQNNEMFDLLSFQAEPVETPTPEPTPESAPVQAVGPAGNVTNGTPVPEVVTETTPMQPVSPSETASIVPVRLASLSVQPTSGIAPLTVQFADQTAVCIMNRTIDFGDGQTSSRRYPSHIYPFPGVYNASLDLVYCDPDDEGGEPAESTITVLPLERQDTLLSGSGKADLMPGAKIYFTVKGPGTTIRIGGRDHILKVGDLVELTFNAGGRGDLSIISNAIVKCDYDDVTLTVNGEEVITGWITGINIDQYDQIATTGLTIEIESFEPGLKGLINAKQVVFAQDGELLRLMNVGPDSTGKLLFSVQDHAGFNFRGGIQTYEVTTPAWATE